MTITLTPEQQEWLEAEVAAGHFSSVEEAVQFAVAELMRLRRDEELEEQLSVAFVQPVREPAQAPCLA